MAAKRSSCASCARPMCTSSKQRKDPKAKAALRKITPKLVFHTAHGLCEGCSSRERRAAGALQVTLVAPDRPAWMRAGLGACASVDPELWYPEEGGPTNRTARRICRGCPFRAPCLEWALLNQEKWGIWGDTTPDERRQLIKARSDAA